MTEKNVPLQPAGGQIAPLANIAVVEQAVARLTGRGPNDPGLGILSAPSGYGKSTAAAWARARHRAYYLQLDDFVTKKSLMVSLCRALGLAQDGRTPKGTIADLADMVGQQLHQSRRLLIIDEFDFAVDKSLVMSIFSIYEKSKASILLIGEEALPAKLEAWEKFSGRVLDTWYAEPVGIEDARILAKHKFPDFHFADDLLEHLCELAKGSVRRVNNNLGRIHDEALAQGWESCDLATWGNRPLQRAEVKRRGK